MKAKLFFLDVMAIDSLPKDLPTLNPSHIWMHEDIRILLIFIRKMWHHPILGQLLQGLENYNSSLKVLFCCCRTFLGLIVINQAYFCLFVQRALWHFVQITENLPMVLLWALLLFWTGGVVIQKFIVMQIMQIETRLQCLSISRYLFYLQFKTFPKRTDISTRKSQKCAFSHTTAIFFFFFAHKCIFADEPIGGWGKENQQLVLLYVLLIYEIRAI